MTAQEFVKLSTGLFEDMKTWVAEAAKDDQLVEADLAILNAAMKVVEQVTFKEARIKPEKDN